VKVTVLQVKGRSVQKIVAVYVMKRKARAVY
jgi:hypothetical protein